MVFSRIDKTINYTETNSVNTKDLEYESYIYRGILYKKNIKFVLGSPQYEYVDDNNIVYFNIYLVNDESVVAKIGLYEVENSKYSDLLDEEGYIILSELNEPLLFDYSKDYILNNYVYDEDIELNESDEDADSDLDEETDMSTDIDSELDGRTDIEDEEDEEDEDKKKEDKPLAIIKEQTKEESDLEMSRYEKDSRDIWINEFMKSHKYSSLENEGGGDCFFAVLRDALNSNKTVLEDGKKQPQLTIKAIREKLALEADETIFQNHKEVADSYFGGMKMSSEAIAKGKKFHKSLKLQIVGMGTSKEKAELIEKAKTNLTKMSSTHDKYKVYGDLIEEFKFMKDVKTLKDFQNEIRKSSFWANAWAIPTLERLYNVKFIILSFDHFKQDDLDNVLQCGDTDKKLQKKGIFEPDFYIIVEYLTNTHYRLVTYDKNIEKKLFNFKELPYRFKELILNRCLEKMMGPFALIPDFKDFASTNSIDLEKDDSSELKPLTVDPIVNECDKDVQIRIHAKANSLPKFGMGVGETLKHTKIENYAETIEFFKKKENKDWRRMLDNDWPVDNLTIEGDNWPSVSHFMYASRFSKVPELYNKFKKIEGKKNLSIKDAETLYNEIFKKSEYNKYKPTIMKESEFKKIRSQILYKALYSKFQQNEDLLNVLSKTGNACITIYVTKSEPVSANELMKVRKDLEK